MPNTTAQKLKIKENYVLLTLNAPANFEKVLEPLPANAKIVRTSAKPDQVHWFVTNKKEMEQQLAKALNLVKADVLCWIYYPKGSSKIQTDLTRDKGWELLLAHDELQWISLISFDETWSTFGIRLKNAADKKKDLQPKMREIFKYVNPTTKEITLPEDLATALQQSKSQAAIFSALSFSNKKEYVEWIVTAKREETRKQRIEATIDRLGKGFKNPNNT